MKKQSFFLLLIVSLIIPLVGCSGGGGGGASSSSGGGGVVDSSTSEGNVIKGYIKVAAVPPATPTPIAGASVNINSKSTSTDSNGYYKITDIADGTWTLNVSATGYKSDSSSWTFITGKDPVTGKKSVTIHKVDRYLQKL